MNEAVSSIISALELGRTDVIRSAISTLEKYEKNGIEEDLKLSDLLNSSLTPVGTILHMASQTGKVDIARTLLSAGADPGVHNSDGQTPLDLASDANIKQVFNEQLLQAVAISDIGRICQLIAAGVDVNMLDTTQSRNTPLHWAASYGNRDVVQCLIKRGACVDALNSDGATPLHDAVARGDIGVIEEMLQGGADPHLAGEEGKYKGVSSRAVAEDQKDLTELMEKYKDHQITNGYIQNMVNGTTEIGDQDQQETIIANGGSPSLQNGPLHLNIEAPPLNRTMSTDSSLASPALSVASTSNVSVVTDSRLHLLWPQPRKLLQRQGKPFKPDGMLTVYISDPLSKGSSSQIIDIWNHHKHYLERLNLSIHMETLTSDLPPQQSQILCQINDQLFSQAQSYRLTINKDMVRLDASDVHGLHYGIITFIQLLKLCYTEGIPPLQISDHPCIRDRGVLLDLSKGRILTESSLRHLIETLSYLKINQLQLYMRFHVPNDPDVRWQFYYARSALLELSRYAESLGVTLVPGVDVLPNVVFDDLVDIYASFDQFISCFTATRTLAVGPRLSSFLMDMSEDGHITSDDTQRLLPVPPNVTVHMCAYMFHESQTGLSEFPQNTVLAEYGFQANYDFATHCQSYEESGVPFTLVPGTAAWNSLAGCPEAAVSNVHAAVQTAVSAGGLGVTISHWSGIGHVTHHPIALTGILTAAGFGWNSGITLDYMHANLADLMNVHVLEDEAGITGQVILELGRAETYILRCSRNQDGADNSKLPAEKGSTLFQLISHPDDVSLEHLSPEVFQKSMRHIRKCQAELEKSQMHCIDGSTVISELQLTADFMLSACKIGRALLHAGKNPRVRGFKAINPGVSNLVATTRTDLANRILTQLEMYRSVWLHRNLPQYLNESLHQFSTLLNQLIPDGMPTS